MSHSKQDDAVQFVTLEPGQPFYLDRADAIWQVWDGTVDVYAVTDAAVRRFQQVFLFSAEQGQPLFGMPGQDETNIRLMVISPAGAELKLMTRSRLLSNAARGGEQFFEVIWFMMEEWLAVLLAGPGVVAPPRIFTLLETGDTVKLVPGQKVRGGRQMLWVNILQGEVLYSQLTEMSIGAGRDLPLTQQAWLTSIGPGEVRALTTEEVFLPLAADEAAFWQKLDYCHQVFLALLQQYFAAEICRDHDRLMNRRQQREKLLCGAATHLLRNDLAEMLTMTATDQSGPPVLGVLQTIARYLGVPEDTVRLSKGSDISQPPEVLMSGITRLAGMQSRKVRLEPGWHQRDNGPMMAYWGEEGRLVALLPKSPECYMVFHPGSPGPVEMSVQDVEKIQTYAYVFYVGIIGKTVTVAEWIKFAVKRAWAGDIWTIVLASLVAGVIPMLTPFVTNTIFSDLIPINDRQGHIMVIQVMMVAAFASAGVALTRGVAFIRMKGHMNMAAEAGIWLRLLALPTAFFRQYESGDLAQRMNGVTMIATALSGASLSTVFNGVFSLCSLAMMCYYSWKLSMIAVLFLLVYVALVLTLSWNMIRYKRKMMIATGKVAGRALQILNGLGKFRMQGAESQAFYLWAKEFGEEWKWNRATRWQNNWLEVVNGAQPILMSMLLFWITMHWMETQEKGAPAFITQVDFLSFNAALGGFNGAIMGMVPMIAQMLDIVPLLERIRPVLEAEPEVDEDKGEAGELTGQIELSRISFRYGAEKPMVLQDVSMKIRPGQFVAIVGSSGSGKSTLLRLLLGFEKPESGAVYFDGQDLADLSVTSVRSQMGVVLQHGQLMAGDIFTNIVGTLPLTQEDAWKAVEMVGLAEDIKGMPMGLNTLISEGATNISGGQRQRILIARAIVHRPRMIVFDEATSALDNQTQSIVTESLDRLNATRIVVAHRLSTIINADYIYVMDKGRVVESGTYKTLIEENGIFAALASRQLL